jgi:magnesium transporter
MPIVASMGGNAGTQSLTVAVRALATRQLTRVNAMRVVRREVLVGLGNGLLFGAAIGGIGAVWFGQPMLGLVLSLAMIANLAVAALAGVITIDDAMSVLDDETEEDLLRLGGVGDEAITDSVAETFRLRFPWLAVNVATAYLAATVISVFEDTIEKIVALAVLMPIVASMGGNAGTQSLTVAVRALATRQLTRVNAMRVVRREVLVGLGNGLVFGAAIGAIGAVWFGLPTLGLVLALAMVANLAIAALAGVLIPMALERAGADPAVSSGTFVTTMTDVVGFFAFLGLASVMLL